MIISWWWVIVSPWHHGVSARRGWTVGIPLSRHWGWNFQNKSLIKYFDRLFYQSNYSSLPAKSSLLLTLTSTHGTRRGRPLGRRASIAKWGSSLHWRGASGRHPFKGVSTPWIIIIYKRQEILEIKNTLSMNLNDKLTYLLMVVGLSYHLDHHENLACLLVVPDCGSAWVGVLVCHHSQTEALLLAPLWYFYHQGTGTQEAIVRITILISFLCNADCLNNVLYLSVHLTGRVLCVTRTFKCNKSKASWLVCFTVLHQYNWEWREMLAFTVTNKSKHAFWNKTDITL